MKYTYILQLRNHQKKIKRDWQINSNTNITNLVTVNPTWFMKANYTFLQLFYIFQRFNSKCENRKNSVRDHWRFLNKKMKIKLIFYMIHAIQTMHWRRSDEGRSKLNYYNSPFQRKHEHLRSTYKISSQRQEKLEKSRKFLIIKKKGVSKRTFKPQCGKNKARQELKSIHQIKQLTTLM